MKTISLRWLRRLIGKQKHSLKNSSQKREQLRKLILENLEPRKLMTSAPWLLPPARIEPPSSFPGVSPIAGDGIQKSPWIPSENHFFGPREIVWISDFQPTSESGRPGYFRVERSNSMPPLQVTFNILADSTAQKNIDYREPKAIVVFEPGVSFVDVPIIAIDDSIAEATESVRVVLWDASRVGTWVPATITSILISDNDFANNITAVELLPPIDAEEGFRDGRLRARRTGPVHEPLVLPFELTFHDGLVFAKDCLIDPKFWSPKTNSGQFLFAPGETLASVIVSVMDDTEAENTEWMNIQLIPSPLGQYQIGGKPLDTLRIADNDTKASNPKEQPRITQVSLVNDTGLSPNDRITWDERIEFLVDGKLSNGFLKTEFDWTGDFIPDAFETIEKTPSKSQFDPQAHDPSLANSPGLRSLRYRSTWYTTQHVIIDQSPWNSFEYQVIQDPNLGQLRFDDLRLKIDTGNPADRVTLDPTVSVSILGEYPKSDSGQSSVRIEWDHTQDGIADATELLGADQRLAQYDPRTIDQNFARTAGPRTLRCRLVEDPSGKPLVAWKSIDFVIADPPQLPWIITGVSDSNPPETPRHWILRGAVTNPSLPQQGSTSLLDPVASSLSIQIDTDQDDQANATIPVASDLSFEHTLENLTPGTHTLKLRVQQWSNEANSFIHGNWIQYSIEVRPLNPPPIPKPQLRSDSGASSSDRITSDPSILIDVEPGQSLLWLSELQIDTGKKIHSIPVGKSTDGNSTTILFQDEAIYPGSQVYKFRTKSIDPANNWQTASDWIEFQWVYNPATAPSMTLALLNDDGSSSSDRITSMPTMVGRLIASPDSIAIDISQIQIDWNSDGTPDDWTIPIQDGSFTIRPELVPLGQRRVSARVQWTDPYRNTPLVGNWNSLNFEMVAPGEQSGEIRNLRLLFDTGRNDTDRISSLATITGLVANPSAQARVQVDRNRDGNFDDEVTIDSSGSFRYSPLSLQHGTHLFHFRTVGLNDQQDSMSISAWQPFDLTYVPSTLEPLVIESLQLANDSGAPQDQKSEQGAILGRLTSLSGIGNSVVLVDLDFDRQADETIAVGKDGRFLYKPKLNSTGQVHVAFQPIRISPLQIEDNTPDRWYDFKFEVEDQTDTAPELYELRYVSSSETTNDAIIGKARSQSDIDGMLVQIDTNGDAQADRISKVTRYADFSLTLDGLAPGDYVYRFRASAPSDTSESMLLGAWKTLSFSITDPSIQRAKIQELRLRSDDGLQDDDRITSDPTILGKVDRDGANSSMAIEIDLDGDSIVDESLVTASDLSFQYTPTRYSVGYFRLRARTKEVLSNGTILRGQWAEIRGMLVPKDNNSSGDNPEPSNPSEHDRGVGQAYKQLASDRQAIATDKELGNQASLASRYLAMRQATSDYWIQTATATIDLQESQSQALEKLREQLRSSSTTDVDLPLPDELAIQWPSDTLPNLPYLVSEWLPADDAMPQPPVLPPVRSVDFTVPKVAWSTSLYQALNHDDPSGMGIDLSNDREFQNSLDNLRKQLVDEQRSVGQRASMATHRARTLYNIRLSDAQAVYREAMAQNGLDLKKATKEDYSEVYLEFAKASQSALAKFQSDRKAIEDRYRSAFQMLSDAQAEQVRTAQRNRDAIIDAANHELRRILDASSRPTSDVIKAALLRHSRITYDARYTYEQSILEIKSGFQAPSYALQREQSQELASIELAFALQMAQIAHDRDEALAERKHQQSVLRATMADRYDTAEQLAHYQLDVALAEAQSELEKALILIEADRRVGNETALRQYDFTLASTVCLALARRNSLLTSSESAADLQQAQQRRDLLRAWEVSQGERSVQEADLWKENALAKITAEHHRQLGSLSDQHTLRIERLAATLEFRTQHARWVQLHANQLAQERFESIQASKQAEYTQRLESGLNGIDFMQRESAIGQESYQRFLSAWVYQPPNLDHITDGWIWIDNSFLGSVWGTAIVPPVTGYQITRDETIAMAELIHQFESKRISIDKDFFNQRDTIEASWIQSVESLAASTKANEFQLYQRYHQATANADEAFALSQVDRRKNYDSAIAQASKEMRCKSNEMALRFARQQATPWLEHQRAVQQIEFNRLLTHWDQYISVVQKWRDTQPNPWTDSVADQAIATRSLSIRKLQIELERAREQANRSNFDDLQALEIRLQSDSQSASNELVFAKDKAAATRELGMALAVAQLQFATQTSGVSYLAQYGLNVSHKDTTTPNLLPLKLETANTTALADIQLAQAQLTASVQKAQAKYTHSVGVNQIGNEFSTGSIDWDQYNQRLAVVDRIYSDRVQQSDKELGETSRQIDNDLRTKRAEILRLLGIEQELAKPIEAQWAWLEDVPKLANNFQAHLDLAIATQVAQDAYARKMADLQIAHQERQASNETRRKIDLRRVQYDTLQSDNLSSESDQIAMLDAQENFQLQQVQARSEYEKRMLQKQSLELEKIYRKLDPNTRLLLKQQAQATVAQHSATREALAWKEFSDSSARRADQSKLTRRNRQTVDQVHQAQLQFEKDTSLLEQNSTIDQSRIEAQWMVATQAASNESKKMEFQVQSNYDQRSQDAIEELNLRLLEQRTLRAEQMGELWKSYYLKIHPESWLTPVSVRRELDNWLGLRVKPEPITAAAWRLQPAFDNGCGNFMDRSPNEFLLHGFDEIRAVEESHRIESQIGFVSAIGQAKTKRIQENSDAKILRIQSTTDADRIHAQQLHTSSVNLNNAKQQLQVQWSNTKDQLELTQAYEDQSQGIDSAQQVNQIERQYQERIKQASIEYSKTWADAQSTYYIATSGIHADRLQQADSQDLRSKIMAAHGEGYAKWIQEVSSDFVDWTTSLQVADASHSHRLLNLGQVREMGLKVAESHYAIENETLQRKLQQDKSALAFEYSTHELQRQYDAIELQRQIDFDYQLLVLSSESIFLQEVERAESTAQLMKLRRYSGFDHAREKGLIVADALYAQSLSDSIARKNWKERTARLSTKVAFEDVQRTQLQSVELSRLDAQLARSRSELDRTRSDAIAQARFEYQVDAIASSGELALNQASANHTWRVAAATARIDARKPLQQAVDGAWSQFMVALAEHELENLETSNESEDRFVHGRAQADSRYTTTIAQAQLDASKAISRSTSAMSNSQIQQNLETFEQFSKAQIDFANGIQVATSKYVQQVTTSERNYADQVASTELAFRKTYDHSTYQARLQQAKQEHESNLKDSRQEWNRSRIQGVGELRTANAQTQRSDRLAQIARESLQAKQQRDARKEINSKEADAYELSEQTWGSIEKNFAFETAAIQLDMAMDLDCELESPWSEFFLDITRAKSQANQINALATKSRVLKHSQKQADHEKDQGVLDWALDSGEWLASDRARASIAQLDWTLEQVSIQGLRILSQASPMGDVPIVIPEAYPKVDPRMPTKDRRYDLSFVQNAPNAYADPFSWQDTGFLEWIRSPQEQFARSFWSLEKISHDAEHAAQMQWSPTVQLATGVLVITDQVSGVPDSIKTPAHALVPKSPLTVEALTPVDRDQLVGVRDWLDLLGRVSSAAQRPDYSELTLDRSLAWTSLALPAAVLEPQRESQTRFFVSDQAQWNEFLRYANESYGAIHKPAAKPELKEWFSKYQKHVDQALDTTRFGLISKHSRAKLLECQDKVFQERGVVYWKHTIGIEPSRIEGAPMMRTAKTAIGTVDSNGWVHLPSGKRVLYSALRKWADALILANSDQISSLIDGLISPFSIDPSSKQFGIFIGGTGMHMFGIGNVERLYNLYQGTKFYYGGVGNPTEYDSLWNAYADNGSGYGWTAILDRIEADVVASYRGHQKMHVFGWSRGAAMGIEFATRMARYSIEVEFLGLFDPVYSYVLPGQSSALVHWTPSGRSGNYVAALPHNNVEAIGTIYAANEDRSFFPATRLYPNGSTQIKMMKSPGAHGEIGGHFLSNLILQRLNLRAMMELAKKEGRVDFQFHGVEADLVGIFASPFTRKMHLESIGKPVSVSAGLTKGRIALGIENWKPMSDDQYYRALVDCTAEDWQPGGFGFQSDNYTGAIAFGLEVINEFVPQGIYNLPWQDGTIRQSPYTHYRRNLQWCQLELWDLEFLQDASGNSMLTDSHKEAIRKMYRLKIDPKTGHWGQT
ncbi:MAG: Calx-beta domain-containing protein [Planctomycetota bacterium]